MIRSPWWSRLIVTSSFIGLVACQSTPQAPESTSAEAVINRDLLTSADDTLEVETQAAEDIWVALVEGFALPKVDEAKLNNHLRWYGNHQRYLDKVVAQSEPYLYYIKKELKKNDMPLELALLPIIESAYDPLANSPSRAAGIWQFIPGTGRAFGLAQNHWFDGRRDLVQSTEAAISYFKRLHGMFDGDWLLAIAAYNAGEGTVSRAVARNRKAGKPTDFWSLSLPKQTTSYVPQLLALAEVVRDPTRFDLSLASIPNQPYFTQVKVNKPIDIAVAARMADLDPHHLRRLNAGHIQWVTNARGPYRILVPIDDVKNFKSVLNELPAVKPPVVNGNYTVKSGDTLGAIAKRNNTTVAAIQTANGLKSTNLRVGQKLALPGQAVVASSVGQSADKALADARRPQTTTATHKVRSGESLWTIARQHKISVAQLQKLNNLSGNSKIKPGQTLTVATSTNVQVVDGKIVYQIKAGDTLNKIAQQFSVTKQNIIAWNNVKDESYIHPGQELTIFVK